MNFLISKNFYKYPLISVIFIFSFFSFCEAVNAADVYYSVGQNATDHKTGSPTITISSGLATFSVAQTATNMGVGDRVTYDTSKVAYISGKVSQTQWNLVTATGAMPINEASPVTVNSIAHEYTSLSAAEAGASDSNHLNTTNLVTGNYVLNFPCYYDSGADTTSVVVDGWTTGASNYIKIYTPNNTSTEVNQSQRHNGVWNNAKYRLETSLSNAYSLLSNEGYIYIDGLQIKSSMSASGWIGGIWKGDTNAAPMYVSNNIAWGVLTSNTYSDGIGTNNPGTDSVMYMWNNIVYGFRNSSGNIYQGGFHCNQGTCYFYNNTAYGNHRGFNNSDGSPILIAKNNLSSNNVDSYSGAFDSVSTHNITDLSAEDGAFGATWATGTTTSSATKKLIDSGVDFSSVQVGSIVKDSGSNYSYVTAVDSATKLTINDDIFSSSESYTVYKNIYANVAFADENNDDFHLAPFDDNARGFGADLSGDSNLPITDDIDGQARPIPSGGSWDIGADEASADNLGEEIDLTSGLVGYWKFSEGSGASVADASGNGNTGTWNGTGAHWNGAGKHGWAGEFNGSDDRVSVGNVYNGVKTITFWLKASDVTSQKLIDIDGTDQIEINGSDQMVATSFPLATVYVDTIQTSAVNNSQWHFVSITDTTGVNGSVVDFGEVASSYLSGFLDEIRMYNRVLSQREIAFLYNNGAPAAKWEMQDNYNDTGGWAQNNSSDAKNLTAGGSGNSFATGFLEEGTTALSLNGSGYAYRADDSNFDISDGQDFSVSATIKTSETGNKTIFAKRNTASSQGWMLGLDYGLGDGKVFFEVGDNTVDEFSINGATNIADNQWHTITAIFDEDNASNCKIYVDGVDDTAGTTGTIGNVASLANANELDIGDTDDGINKITAQIDRVAFYLYVLTAADAARDKNAGFATRSSHETSTQASGSNWDPWGGASPVGWWKMDAETSGSADGDTVQDWSANSNNGTGNNGGNNTGLQWTSGKVGNAIDFDGVDDFVDIPDSPVFDFGTGNFSYGCRVKTTDPCTFTDIFFAHYTGTTVWNIGCTSSGKAYSSVRDSNRTFVSSGESSTTINNGVWHHIVSVKSGNDLILYVNGKKENSGSGSFTGNFNSLVNQTIGKHGSDGRHIDSEIDDCMIFNYALSQAQVSWLYNGGKPVGHWKFDENSSGSADGASLVDSSGNGNFGTGNDGANNTGLDWRSNGKINNAIEFDGTDDYVDFISNFSQINKTDPWSVSVWAKTDVMPPDRSSADTIWANSNSSSDRTGLQVFNNKVVVGIYNGSTYFTQKEANISTNTWYNIISVFDGSNIHLWIDGIESNTVGENPSLYSGVDFNIGSRTIGSPPDQYFDGLIDDVRIYNYALTNDQIRQVYNEGARVKFK